jgi:hypothetical protein
MKRKLHGTTSKKDYNIMGIASCEIMAQLFF